jgi:nicotinamide riboside kinase
VTQPRPQELVVAVLGAESTGKTTLAHQLAQSLSAQGHDAVVVHETLREFCEVQGRTPRVDEQLGIALAHSQRISRAASEHQVVIADTTALMTAVYSDFIFGDLSLYEEALVLHRVASVTLLMALDLPWVPDGHQRDGPHVQGPVDDRIRSVLIRSGVSFSVIGGQGATRLVQAIQVVGHALGAADRVGESPSPRWQWVCEDCDDPQTHLASLPKGLISGLTSG